MLYVLFWTINSGLYNIENMTRSGTKFLIIYVLFVIIKESRQCEGCLQRRCMMYGCIPMLKNADFTLKTIMACLLLAPACILQATNLTSITENSDTIGQYEKYESTFTLNRTYTNPFDTDEVEINATITQPDLSTVQVPVFYYRYYQVSGSNPETYSNPGPEQWKFRFRKNRRLYHCLSSR